MFESLKVRYLQTMEAMKEGGIKHVFQSHPQVYKNRVATPVVMDLTTANIAMPTPPPNTSFQFAEIKLEDLQAGKWTFAVPSRGAKAWVNLKCGLRCFAVVEGNKVVGDIWGYILPESGMLLSHPEIKMMTILGITLQKGDAYGFDMVIDPAYRGKSLATPLQRFLQVTMKNEGCGKVYGYYWEDNIPALWMHRMLKFKELPKLSISRFFFRMQVRQG